MEKKTVLCIYACLIPTNENPNLKWNEKITLILNKVCLVPFFRPDEKGNEQQMRNVIILIMKLKCKLAILTTKKLFCYVLFSFDVYY